MRLYTEPPLECWQPGSLDPTQRPALGAKALENARRLGTGTLATFQTLIATGHQAWLWHPGILAKDLAAQSWTRTHPGGWFHLVVDTDVHEALTVPLPRRDGWQLRLEKLVLGSQHKLVPSGAHPPVDIASMRAAVQKARTQWRGQLAVDLSELEQAIEHLAQADCCTLAQQMTVLQKFLIRSVVDPWPIIFESQLSGWDGFKELMNRMLDDPIACIQAYNQAVKEHPHSGMTVLRCDEKRMELPLWLMPWDKPRLRVFAERSGSGWVLFDEQRRRIDLAVTMAEDAASRLVPRAAFLTALLRSAGCDLFVHGRGGEHYDPVMERWWQLWQHQPLAPMATVSADLCLSFDVPVHDPADLHRAVWWAHHLPHNWDRVLHLQDDAALEKRRLLGQLATLTDPMEKARAFNRLHQLNGQWTQAFAPILEQAREQILRYRAGVTNRVLAQKRDWPVAWYPPESLKSLWARFHQS